MAKCPICGGPMKPGQEVCDNCKAFLDDAPSSGSTESHNTILEEMDKENSTPPMVENSEPVEKNDEEDDELKEDIGPQGGASEKSKHIGEHEAALLTLKSIKGHSDFFGQNPTDLSPEDIEKYHSIVDSLEFYFREKGELYPSKEVYLITANLARIMGDIDIATDLVNKAIRLDPNYSEAWGVRGRIYDQMGRIEDAVRSYERALKGMSDNVDLLMIMGQMYLDLGRESDALEAYKSVCELDPGRAEAWEAVGNILYSEGDFSQAKKAYDKANQIRLSTSVEMLDKDMSEGGGTEDYKRAVRLLKDVTDDLIDARNIGVSIPNAEEEIDNIKTLIKNGEYNNAILAIDDFRATIENGYKERVEDAYHTAEETIKKIREDIIVPLAEELLDRAKETMEAGEYKKSLNYSNLAIEDANNAHTIYENSKKAIQNAWSKINDAKKAGNEVAVAEVLLEQARAAVKKKDYSKAEEYARKAEEAATPEREKLTSKIVNRVSDIRKRLKILSDGGMDTTGIERIITAVEGRLEKDDLEKAEEYANKADTESSELLKKLQVKEAASAISTAEIQLKDAKNTVTMKELLRSPAELLERAQKDFDTEDYTAARDMAEKAIVEINKVIEENVFFNYKRSLDSMVKDIEMLRDEYGFMGAEDLLEVADKISNLIKNRDVHKLKAEFDSFEEKYNKEKKRIFLGTAPMIFANMERAIESLSGLGTEAEKYQKRLDDIKRIFDMGNIERAMTGSMDLLKEITDLKKNRLKNIVPDELVRVRNRITQVRDRGGVVTASQEKLKEAVALFDAEKYEDVLERLSEINKELRVEEIGLLIDELNGIVSRIKGYSQPTESLDTLVAGAREKFGKKDIEGAEGNLKMVLKDITKNIIKEIIRAERKKGIETKNAEYALLEASKAADADDLVASKENIQKAFDELDRAKKKKELIDTLKETRDKILSLKAKGVDVSDFKRRFVRAKECLSSGLIEDGWPEARTLAEDVGREYSQVCEKEERVKDILRETKELAHKISEMGGGKMLKEFKSSFDRAKAYMKDKKFDKAIESAEKSLKKAREIYKYRNLLELLKTARKELDTAEAIGIDTKRAEGIFRKAKPALEIRDYDTATEFAEMALKEIEKAKKKRTVGELIRKAFLKISGLKEKGIDVSIPEGFLSEARSALRIDDLDEAEEKANLAIDTAGKTKDVYERAGSLVVKVEGMINEVKKMGIATPELEEKASAMKKAVMEDRTDEATALANEISTQITNLKKAHEEVSSVMEMARRKVGELKKLGVHTSGIDKYIQEMERSAANGQIERSKDLARLAYEEAEKTKHTFNEVINLVQLAQTRIKETKLKGYDTSHAEAMFNDTLMFIENGDYEKARKKVKGVISETLSAQLVNTVSSRTSSNSNQVIHCSNCGAPVSPDSDYCPKCGQKIK